MNVESWTSISTNKSKWNNNILLFFLLSGLILILSIIHVHSLTNNPNSKHRSIRLNLTFEISHKESSKDKKKNEIMLGLTFEGLADQIRIQHWQGGNFICRSGWILSNTPTKMTLTFWRCGVKVESLAIFSLLCKENLCVNVERALKTAELRKHSNVLSALKAMQFLYILYALHKALNSF